MKKKDKKPFIPDFFFKLLLIALGAITLYFIALLKTHSVQDAWRDPILIVYTLFVGIFELTRIVAAVLYTYSHKHLMKGYDLYAYEPTISFVIPCKDEGGTIGDTIDKCFAVDYPLEKVQVVIINDGSTDNTIDVCREKQIEYPQLEVVDWKVNRGKRHGMATGFKMATGEIIVQLDSDSFIVPSTIRNLISPFRDEEIGAVCAHAEALNADTNFITRMQAAYYFLSFRILKAAESTFMSVFCCSGCSSAYRKSIVLPILDTWLNETFLGLPVTWGDDRGLTNWVLKLGYKTIYADDALAYTICPDSFKIFFKQQVRWKKGWFVNSIFASKFLYKQKPLIAFTYFFPLILITLITPFMAVRAFLYLPIVDHTFPFIYVTGSLLVACLMTIFYRYVARGNKYWPYVFAWALINMVFLSFILFYALATIQNRKWGTR